MFEYPTAADLDWVIDRLDSQGSSIERVQGNPTLLRLFTKWRIGFLSNQEFVNCLLKLNTGLVA